MIEVDGGGLHLEKLNGEDPASESFSQTVNSRPMTVDASLATVN
jgi:hypothetical protein